MPNLDISSIDTLAEWVLANLYLVAGIVSGFLLVILLALLVAARRPRKTTKKRRKSDFFDDAPSSRDEMDFVTPLTAESPDVSERPAARPAAAPAPPRDEPVVASKAGVEHAASIVGGMIDGRGDLTPQEYRRIELMRPEHILAAVTMLEPKTTGRGKESQRTRLAKIRQHAELLLPTETGPGEPVPEPEAPHEADFSAAPLAAVIDDLPEDDAVVPQTVNPEAAESSAGREAWEIDDGIKPIPYPRKRASSGTDRWEESSRSEPAATVGPASTPGEGPDENGPEPVRPWPRDDEPTIRGPVVDKAPTFRDEPMFTVGPDAEDEPVFTIEPHSKEDPTFDLKHTDDDAVFRFDRTSVDDRFTAAAPAPIVAELGTERSLPDAVEPASAPEETAIEEDSWFDPGVPSEDETWEIIEGEEVDESWNLELPRIEPTAPVVAATPAVEPPPAPAAESLPEPPAGRPAEPAAQPQEGSSSEPGRSKAAAILSGLAPQELARLFTSATDTSTKMAIIEALDRPPTTEIIGVLQTFLDDPDPAVQMQAVQMAERLLSRL